MPKIDLNSVEQVNRTGYPPPFNEDVQGRWYRRLAPAAGLTDFGVSQVTLKPGAWSSQRHWHNGEDEFLVMLTGEAVLVEDDGRTVMRPGDCAAWPKGGTNGHHLRNESDDDCVFVVVGGGENTGGGYSDIDMMFTADGEYVHKDGSPYGESGAPGLGDRFATARAPQRCAHRAEAQQHHRPRRRLRQRREAQDDVV